MLPIALGPQVQTSGEVLPVSSWDPALPQVFQNVGGGAVGMDAVLMMDTCSVSSRRRHGGWPHGECTRRLWTHTSSVRIT